MPGLDFVVAPGADLGVIAEGQEARCVVLLLRVDMLASEAPALQIQRIGAVLHESQRATTLKDVTANGGSYGAAVSVAINLEV